jgi:hypothetical protein
VPAGGFPQGGGHESGFLSGAPAAYPDPETEDVHEALRFAAEAVRERELPLIKTA